MGILTIVAAIIVVVFIGSALVLSGRISEQEEGRGE